jgi:tetratricopeptide (TPR) repeat protein
MPEGAASSLNAASERAAALLTTNPARAEREAQAILTRAPNDPRALLILASARRRQGDAKAAHVVLQPLARAYPRAAMTHYELGLVLADLGDANPAITALRRATSLNRELTDAWRALGDLLFLQGDVTGAEAAFAEHARSAVTDPALKPAAKALFEGRLEVADDLLRAHVAAHLNDVAAMKMLAEVRVRQTRYDDAEVLLSRCLELDSANDAARFVYAEALYRQQKAAEATAQAERLLARKPTDAAYRNLLAGCLALIGDDARSISLYDALLVDYPTQPRLWLNLGHGLRAVGRQEDAMAAYKRCMVLAPSMGDAYWSVANLKTASFTPEEEAAMRLQAKRPDLPAEDRLHFHYALGKALEDRRDYAAAFEHYASGAKLRRGETPYSADEIHAQTLRSLSLFTRGFFAEQSGSGYESAEPIFIVGLPRSGSTLIEQILASHSQVEGTMELPHIGLIAQSLAKGSAFADLGRTYIAETKVYRTLGKSYFIDKMPNNFMHVGLIHLILPNAKIIDARRHPMGSSFSAFKQLFAQGQAFSYDLTDIGRYYRDYVDLMRHFDQALPGRVHRVIYEDMVEDTETEVRRLLDYCGLPFEDACLRFYETSRTVRTVSSEQVRRPIFRDGIDQWRNFEPWLDPLKAALGPALESWRN